MANTTFNGPVRSENGFTVVSKNSSTGAVTTSFTLDGSGMQVTPVALADTTAISLTAATHGGTGLGLAIVKHILEGHNQTINVRSTKGVGSTFSFILEKGK